MNIYAIISVKWRLPIKLADVVAIGIKMLIYKSKLRFLDLLAPNQQAF
jgi:hypothetical protein